MNKLKAFLQSASIVVPTDLGAGLALAVGLVLLFSLRGGAASFHLLESPRHGGPPRVRFLGGAAFAAAFLSLGYIAHYLGGGPRIIDATTYFLEGRSLAAGGFTFDVPMPTAGFRGRFLLFSEPSRLGGIFPPGYPLLLAFGFVIGAPLVIGPALAAGITATTYWLAREIGLTLFDDEASTERAARGAALVSVACGALRYHTADTMSHGAAALFLTLGLAALLLARRTKNRPALSLLGLSLGALIATRPVSALPLLMATGLHLTREERRGGSILRVALFALPGVALLLGSQASVAGSALASTQKAYYAASDGPRDCFRYGFGAGVGCLFEHGDFVRARLSEGFGPLAALMTTLRRLWHHSMDATNLELLSVALLALVVRHLRAVPAARIALVLAAGQLLAYAPFYFDGSYPGGGARFLADVLPLEHALFAVALVRAAQGATSKSGASEYPGRRGIVLVLSLMALAFSVRAVREHIKLMVRDGGRPMFEPDLVRESRKDHGLIFFDSDQGFNLALQPGVTASHGILAVRRRGDDRDRWLYESLGRPSTHRYVFGDAKSTLEPYIPTSSGPGIYRFESEGEWPPLSQRGGYVEPVWAAGYASGDRYLRFTPDGRGAAAAGQAAAELELLVPEDGRYSIEVVATALGGGGVGHLRVLAKGAEVAAVDWTDAPEAAAPPGAAQKPKPLELGPRIAALASPARLLFWGEGAPVGLDKITLRRQSN